MQPNLWRWVLGTILVVLAWNISSARPWRVSAQGPSGVFTIGERLEIRSPGGAGVNECTVTRVADSWLQCKEQPFSWWNTQQVIQVVRKTGR